MFQTETADSPHPTLASAFKEACAEASPPYGGDRFTDKLRQTVQSLFECDCTIVLVPSGTAANALALAYACNPGAAIFCHKAAHIVTSEEGAAEHASGGHLMPLEGAEGRLDAAALADALSTRSDKTQVPGALSITQLTELGTLYDLDEIASLASIARRHGYKVHMDGARFCNALVTLGCTPAQMSWKQGVDILSLGITKNGGTGTDLVVVFDQSLMSGKTELLRRLGYRQSRQAPASAQAESHFTQGLWIENARRANAAAATLADAFSSLPGFELIQKVQGNLLFVRIQPDVQKRLYDQGWSFHKAHRLSEPHVFRIVTSYASTTQLLEECVVALRAAASSD